MKLTWYGHSCFLLESAHGSVVFDPYAPGKVPGWTLPALEADAVLCSHGHSDHGYAEGVKLTGRPYAAAVTRIGSFHDDCGGALRGENTISLVEDEGIRAVHMGDVGVTPAPEQIEQLKGCDVLMIPTGGILTIEPDSAFYMTERIMPRVVIPMHFKVPGHSNWRLRTREYFSEIFIEQPILPVKEYDTCSITVTKDTEPQVALLRIPDGLSGQTAFPRAKR